MFRGVTPKTGLPICLWFTDREARRSSDFKGAMKQLLQSGFVFKASPEGWIGTPVRLFSKRSQSPSRVGLRDMARRTTKFSSPTMRQWFDFFNTVPNGISTLATEWFFNATGFRLDERKRAVVQLWNALPAESLPTNGTRVSNVAHWTQSW
jgi:hypothetical protein